MINIIKDLTTTSVQRNRKATRKTVTEKDVEVALKLWFLND